MLQNIKLIVAYDGTNYYGWQSQLNGRTVQEVIEKACNKIFKKKIRVTGSSRTDAGVHADYQVVAIQVDSAIEVEKYPLVFSQVLPHDVVVVDAELVSMEFHPTEDAKYKQYKYSILYSTRRVPKLRNYTYFYYKNLDIDAMSEAAKGFIGTHDFSAFCSADAIALSKVRTIFDVRVEQENNLINIYVTGDGFLHNMVRIIAGTLVKVGEKKIDKNEIINIIESKERKKAGPTAPPEGLTLEYVSYEEWGR